MRPVALLLAVAVSLVLIGGGYGEDLPPVKKDCGLCHIKDKMDEGAPLKAPLSDLCLDCHPDRRSPADHEVDVVPSMKVIGLPLDEIGRMTCITCHDPHGKDGFIKLLRDMPNDICGHCHRM